MNLARGTKGCLHSQQGCDYTVCTRHRPRERGIELVAAQTTPQQPSDRQLIVAQADCTTSVSDAAGVRFARQCPASQQLPAAGLVPTLEALADHAGRDAARCILLSENTVVACVAANRFPAIRAVTATESTTLKTSSIACAANVLILEPKGFLGWQPRPNRKGICSSPN